MGFLFALGLLVAAVVVAAAVLVVWNVSPRRWARIAGVAGAAALVTGIVLYVVFVGIALDYYDEQASPRWLNGLAIVALLLAGGGLLAIVSATLGLRRR